MLTTQVPPPPRPLTGLIPPLMSKQGGNQLNVPSISSSRGSLQEAWSDVVSHDHVGLGHDRIVQFKVALPSSASHFPLLPRHRCA